MTNQITDLTFLTVERKTVGKFPKVVVTAQNAAGVTRELQAFDEAWNKMWEGGQTVRCEIERRQVGDQTYYNILRKFEPPAFAAPTPLEAPRMPQDAPKPAEAATGQSAEMRAVLGKLSEVHQELRAIREFLETEADFATQMKVISREATE